MYSNAIINMPIKQENLKKLERIKLEFVAARTEDMKSCELFLLLSLYIADSLRYFGSIHKYIFRKYSCLKQLGIYAWKLD